MHSLVGSAIISFQKDIEKTAELRPKTLSELLYWNRGNEIVDPEPVSKFPWPRSNAKIKQHKRIFGKTRFKKLSNYLKQLSFVLITFS